MAIEQLGDSLMGFVVAGAAAAGAVLMKFGGPLLTGGKSSVSVDPSCAQQMLNQLENINDVLTKMLMQNAQILAESIEMRKVVHTNTRVMDSARQEVANLRVDVGRLEGRING
jgi:hypothetical protein